MNRATKQSSQQQITTADGVHATRQTTLEQQVSALHDLVGNRRAAAYLDANSQRLEQEAQQNAERITKGSRPDATTTSNKVTESSTINLDSSFGTGLPLDSSQRSLYESQFQHRMDNVRLHTNRHAREIAQMLNARAFTVGNHIVFGASYPPPTSLAGQKLLSHELTHVVQQGLSGNLRIQRQDENHSDSIMVQYRRYKEKSKAKRKLSFQVWKKRYGPHAIRRHHLIPQEFTKQIGKNAFKHPAVAAQLEAQRIDIHRWIIDIPQKYHKALHRNGWNLELETWFRQNPAFTKSDLRQKINSMLEAADIPKKYRRTSVRYGRKPKGKRASRKQRERKDARRSLHKSPASNALKRTQRQRSQGKSNAPKSQVKPQSPKKAVVTFPAKSTQPSVIGKSGTPKSQGKPRQHRKAVIGVPSKRIQAPATLSSRGSGMAGGIELAFQGLNFGLNWLNDHIQAKRVQTALNQIEPHVAKKREEQKNKGTLLLFYYSQRELIGPENDSILRPGPVFSHLEIASGRTQSEASQNFSHTARISPAPLPHSTFRVQKVWIPPLVPTKIVDLQRPFPAIARAMFPVNQAILQGVEWNGIYGFDDRGQTRLHERGTVQFVVLAPPSTITLVSKYGIRPVSIPLVNQTTANGKPIQAVDLDPISAWNVTAVPIFPLNEATVTLFKQAAPTRGRLPQFVNLNLVRWVRPENIWILGS